MIVNADDSIFVSGHRGMVGGAVVRALRKNGFNNLLLASREQLDLADQRAVFGHFSANRPAAQIICAAVVGGIAANSSYPADFIGQNLMIQTNLLEAARRFACGKTLFMASGCIYPRETPQPMKEEQLLTGPLEPTNQWYAVAKIAGVKMGQAYRRQFGLDIVSLLPANLYGPGDNFSPRCAHVIPALMRKMREAKIAGADHVVVWGGGGARREFMHVDDAAEAAVFILRQTDVAAEILNIGGGEELTISEVAELIRETIGFGGELRYDATKPDGAPRKLLDSSRLAALGWRPRRPLAQGLANVYAWLQANAASLRDATPGAHRA